jgi:hypothetical protein
LIASPIAALAAVDATHDPPYHPERSSWDDASAWLDDNADEGDVIVSTRPELSMWYFGRTDYFFRQNGVESPEFRDGVYVHTRTGTVYLNKTEDIRQLLNSDRDVWLFAGKKFRGSFTDPGARQFVVSNFERYGDPSWTNLRIYQYEPTNDSEPANATTSTPPVGADDSTGTALSIATSDSQHSRPIYW